LTQYKFIFNQYKNNNKFNDIKINMYNNINNLKTSLLYKKIMNLSGGDNDFIKNKFSLVNTNLDYNLIRFELFKVTEKLYRSIIDLKYFANKNINKIINNKINNKMKMILKDFYDNFDELYNFCKLYDYNIIKNIDFSYKNITKFEIDNVIKLFDSYDVDSYKNCLDSIHRNYITIYDEIIDKLKNNKFYLDHKKILNDNELYFSSLLSYIFDCSIEIEERENIGYLFKIILNEYDYSIVRNVLANLYHNEKLYNDIKKGKKKLVRCFDKYTNDYKTDIIIYSYDSDDDEKLEDYEENYISHYDKIKEILK